MANENTLCEQPPRIPNTTETINVENRGKIMRNSARDVLLSQVRECYGKVAWSHKTHECESSHFHVCDVVMIWLKIVLAVFAAAGGIGQFFMQSFPKLFTAICTSLVLLVDLIDKFRNYARQSDQHRDTATKLWRIRESYFSLIAELMSDQCDVAAVKRRNEELADELATIYANAPRTSQKAYNQATEKLHSGECSCSDEEIDKLLPPRLRRIHD